MKRCLVFFCALLSLNVGLAAVNEKESSFILLFESIENGIRIEGVKGCEFTELNFTLGDGEIIEIDRYGMLNSSNEERLSDDQSSFRIAIEQRGELIYLKGLRGINFLELSFSCPIGRKQLIDQNGMLAMPSGLENEMAMDGDGYPPGSAIPSKLSIELIWEDSSANVDLWVCKGDTCVNGHRNNRKHSDIGVWSPDLGETTFYGLLMRSSLRSNIEAVRQIEERKPGTFDIYGYFKGSDIPASSVDVKVLIYSNSDDGAKTEDFQANLTLGEKKKKLASVELLHDGDFNLTKY